MQEMPKIQYLILRRQTWYIRLRIPAELRPFYKSQKEILRSLKTRDYKEAKKRLSPAKSDIEADFEKKRQQLRAKNDNTDALSGYSEHDLIQLTRKWFSDIRADQENRRIKDNGTWSPDRKLDYHDELKQEEFLAREEVLGMGEDEHHRGVTTASQFLEAEGLSYSTDSPNFRKLGYFFSKAIHELAQQSLREYEGKPHLAGDALFREPVVQNSPAQKRTIRMGKLIDEFLDDPTMRRSESTIKNYRIIKRAVGEIIGNDTYAHDVTRDQCKAISALLINLPSNAVKKLKKATTLREAVEMGASANLPKVADTTYNMYMQKLDAVMEYALRESYLTSNPAKKLYVSSVMKSKSRRNPFKLEHLQTIFNSDLYRERRKDALLYDPNSEVANIYARYWIPFIGLWTGMRLNEICQLYLSDIVVIDNVSVILIRETDGEEDDLETEKRVKTENGIRYVPMHPMLIKAGLLQYIASISKAGKTRLFPDLKLDKRGYYSHEFSKWFSRFLTDIGAKTKRTSFHSFRHTYRDAIRKAKLSRDAGLQLGGWSSGATDDDYGDGLDVRELYTELCNIEYKGLDLSHLLKG